MDDKGIRIRISGGEPEPPIFGRSRLLNATPALDPVLLIRAKCENF